MLDHRDLYTPDVLAGLEAYIAAQGNKDTLSKAANDLLREALTGLGLMPYEELAEGEDDGDLLAVLECVGNAVVR